MQASRVKAGVVRSSVIALRDEHPEWTATRIAEETKVSPQHVGRILMKAGRPTLADRFRPMVACGHQDCSNSWLEGRENRGKRYCSDACRKAVSWVTVRCHQCGTEKAIRRAQYNRSMGATGHDGRYLGRFFCGRRCFGVHAGTTYGLRRRWRGLRAMREANQRKAAPRASRREVMQRKAWTDQMREDLLVRLQNYLARLEGEIAWLRTSSPDSGAYSQCLEEEAVRLKAVSDYYSRESSGHD
jgi:hypothetical protein